MSYDNSRYWIDMLFTPPRYPVDDDNAMGQLISHSQKKMASYQFSKMFDEMQRKIDKLESEREQFKADVVKNTQVKIVDSVSPVAQDIKKTIDNILKGE